ncbi:MAG: hypothetical protein V7604_5278, partial [Hyphomicrobiales bacterium]
MRMPSGLMLALGVSASLIASAAVS